MSGEERDYLQYCGFGQHRLLDSIWQYHVDDSLRDSNR